jgi:transcriptional regulator with XRE-family HTH domain
MLAGVLVDAEETARRVRAAQGYSGYRRIEDLAQASGVSKDILRRLVLRKNPQAADRDQLEAIADACEVPYWFVEHGFNPPAEVFDATSHGDRLTAVEDQVRVLLEAAGAQAPAGDRGHRLSAGECAVTP